MHSILALIARLLLTPIFLGGAVHKVVAFGDNLEGMGHVPAAPAALVVATMLELVGSVMLLLGIWGRLGASLLVVFLVPVTLLMHPFWAVEGDQAMQEVQTFMRNMAILAALLMFVAHGTGRLSMDRFFRRRRR